MNGAKSGQENMPKSKLRNQLRSVCAGGFLFVATAVPAQSGDWTSASVTVGRSAERPAATGITLFGRDGLQLEADRDYGALVVGGSFSQGLPGRQVGIPLYTETERVDLRAGYDFGRTLGYVTLGSHEDPSWQGGGSGETFGIGLRVSINRALQLTGEFLHHSFRASETDDRQQVETLAVRAAFRF